MPLVQERHSSSEAGMALSAPQGQTLSGTVCPNTTCITCPSARSLLQASLTASHEVVYSMLELRWGLKHSLIFDLISILNEIPLNDMQSSNYIHNCCGIGSG